MPLMQLGVLSLVWFVVWASMIGPLSLYLNCVLKRCDVKSVWIRLVAIGFYGCLSVVVYYAVLFAKVSGVAPYEGLSNWVVFLVGLAPFLLIMIVFYWLLPRVKLGW